MLDWNYTKWFRILCLVNLRVILLGSSASAIPNDLIIQTTSGRIKGFSSFTNGTAFPKPYISFLGIPYAQPPVKSLRLQKPLPITLTGSEVLQAKTLAPPCPQKGLAHIKDPWINIFSDSDSVTEDCLYLNLWLPKNENDEAQLAVMIWIPGGEFSGGSASLPIYDGAILASENNVAVVTVNYRVGALGFMALKRSGTDSSDPKSPWYPKGNMGLYDQRLAIKWVYDNALIFGGDPKRITLFGQNAGAVSVEAHVASPFSWPYFSRVIMQSGTLLSPLNTGRIMERLYEKSADIFRDSGCVGQDSPDCLKMIDVIRLRTNSSESATGLIHIPMTFGPNLYEEWFWEDPKSLETTKFYKHKLDVMVGSNLREGLYFAGMSLPSSKAQRNRNIQGLPQNTLFDLFDNWEEVIKQAIIFQYSDWESDGGNVVEFFDALIGDYYFTCPIARAAEAYHNFGENVYKYHFVHEPINGLWPAWTQAKHADEIPYVFGQPFIMAKNYGLEEILLSQRIMKYWTNFAKTGDPNNDEFGRNTVNYWPKFDLKEKSIMAFNGSSYNLVKGVHQNKCAFWNLYLPYLINATRSDCLQGKLPIDAPNHVKNQKNESDSIKRNQTSDDFAMMNDFVKTTSGNIRGFVQDVVINNVTHKVNTFLGIPFAQAPTGDLRFKLPQPLAPPDTSVVINATQLAPACYQMPETFFGDNFTGSTMYNANTPLSEDCLYLNIWTPGWPEGQAPKPATKRAIMVWIHGGGFSTGSPSLEIYDGKMLAARAGVIIINISYRLGPLGFLYLSDNATLGAAGNMGLYDQRLALKWIHDNAQAFGGDNRAVTLFGQSAGAVAIDMHVLSAPSWPYFSRVIMESGAASNFFTLLSKAKASQYSATLVNNVGCGNLTNTTNSPQNVLDCLRQVPPQNLTLHGAVIKNFLSLQFIPVMDEGGWFTSYPFKAIVKGKFKRDVSILMGNNLNEGSFFMFYGFPSLFLPLNRTLNLTMADYNAAMKGAFFALNATRIDLVTSYYASWFDTDNQYNLVDAFEKTISDFFISCDINRAADLYSEYGTGSVYKYYFQHRSAGESLAQMDRFAAHGRNRIRYGEPVKFRDDYEPDEIRLSETIMTYWTNFAKTGNPNMDLSGLDVGTTWPRYTPKSKLCLTLNTDSMAITRGPRLEECQFRSTFFPSLFSTYSGVQRSEEIEQAIQSKMEIAPYKNSLLQRAGQNIIEQELGQHRADGSIITNISPPNNYGPFNVKLFYYLFGKNSK